jgi:hypothetical protein
MLFLIKTHKTINRRYAQLKNMSIFVVVCYTTPDVSDRIFHQHNCKLYRLRDILTLIVVCTKIL